MAIKERWVVIVKVITDNPLVNTKEEIVEGNFFEARESAEYQFGKARIVNMYKKF